jgi:hypothetical protein
VSEEAIMQDDLRELLDALGMFSGAQPQSPHEVMQNAIAVARRLRAALERIRDLPLPHQEVRVTGEWRTVVQEIARQALEEDQ